MKEYTRYIFSWLDEDEGEFPLIRLMHFESSPLPVYPESETLREFRGTLREIQDFVGSQWPDMPLQFISEIVDDLHQEW